MAATPCTGFYTGKVPPKASAGRRPPSSASKAVGFALRDGEKGEVLGSNRLLWHQGDTLRLTLDCRHHLPWPVITLVNTVNQAEYSCEAKPRRPGQEGKGRSQNREARVEAGSSSSSGTAAGMDGGQQAAAGTGLAGQEGQRAGASGAGAGANGPADPPHQGLAAAAAAAAPDGAVAAAEARGQLDNGHPKPTTDALHDQAQESEAGGAARTSSSTTSRGDQQQLQQQQGLGEISSSSAAADGAAAGTGSGAEVVGGGGGGDGESSWLEWVLVVGLTRPGDQVRILSARRLGTSPHMREW
jgi:hypothetical protein